ncbi:Predicted ATPase involved in chromosome partitioning [gamma proteobacterium HdN1]|nr:Predicted ATPase involved in chromosome partitioning [gamma proteobacterium HdN1]
MRRVIFNKKGGVGKSSIAANLAAISAHRGLRTLLVDLDTQCNSTRYVLGGGVDTSERNIGTFYAQTLSFRLRGRNELTDCITRSRYPNLDVIASNSELGDIMSQLETRHKIFKLREAIASLRQYDAIYIDTPPAYNFYTLSALIAAEACLIPFDCDEFSRQALYSLLENVEETRADHNPELEVEGIIVNQYQPRASLPQRVVEQLRTEGLPILDAFISSSVKMRESHDVGEPLIYMAPNHKLTREFVDLFNLLHPGFAPIGQGADLGRDDGVDQDDTNTDVACDAGQDARDADQEEGAQLHCSAPTGA